MQGERVAVVTVSSTGNGFETSLLLAKNGFYTYATMRNLDKSTRIKEIAKKDSTLLDVTDDKSVADAIHMISNKHRRIDVLSQVSLNRPPLLIASKSLIEIFRYCSLLIFYMFVESIRTYI